MRSQPIQSMTWRRSSGFGGSSIGCVVYQMCSRTYSDGGRLTCGTSSRMRAQCWSRRQHSDGTQAKPPSTSTSCRSGKRSNTPSKTRLAITRLHRRHVGVVVLEVIGRPAAAGDGVSRHAARRAGRAAAWPRGRLEDRPVAAAAERLERRGAQVTCTKCLSVARFSISFTAASGSSCGTWIEPRSRGSFVSQTSSCQSLIAEDSAAPKSWLRWS